LFVVYKSKADLTSLSHLKKRLLTFASPRNKKSIKQIPSKFTVNLMYKSSNFVFLGIFFYREGIEEAVSKHFIDVNLSST